MAILRLALDRLHRAIEDKGPMPLVHDNALKKLHYEWPQLHSAIEAVLKADTARGRQDG